MMKFLLYTFSNYENIEIISKIIKLWKMNKIYIKIADNCDDCEIIRNARFSYIVIKLLYRVECY